MAINGIGNSMDFEIRSPRQIIRNEDLQQNNHISEPIEQASQTTELEERKRIVSPKPEVEFQFNLKRGKDTVGETDNSQNSGIMRRIPDVKKDEVLDQYKFFVKPKSLETEDGTVRRVIRN